jgi:hypothetical protein
VASLSVVGVPSGLVTTPSHATRTTWSVVVAFLGDPADGEAGIVELVVFDATADASASMMSSVPASTSRHPR